MRAWLTLSRSKSLAILPLCLSAACSAAPQPGEPGPQQPAPPSAQQPAPPSAQQPAPRSDPAATMIQAYSTEQSLTVDGFSVQFFLALDGDSIYVTDVSQVVRIDRATGAKTVLVSGIMGYAGAMATDATHVYFVDEANDAVHHVLLRRVPKAGGATETVLSTTPEQRPVAIVANEGTLYLATGSEIQKMAVGDAAPTTLTTFGPSVVPSLAVAADGIYYGTVYSDGTVARAPLAGGAATTLQRGPNPEFLASAAEGVYWSTAPGIMDVTSPRTIYFVPPGGATPQVAATVSDVGDFTVNDLGFYWCSYYKGTIRAVPRGGRGNDFDLIDAGGNPSAIAADARGLVWGTHSATDGSELLHILPRRAPSPASTGGGAQ